MDVVWNYAWKRKSNPPNTGIKYLPVKSHFVYNNYAKLYFMFHSSYLQQEEIKAIFV